MKWSDFIEQQTDRVNKVWAGDFKALCAFAKVEPTRRQARKYAQGTGRAYDARHAFEMQKTEAGQA